MPEWFDPDLLLWFQDMLISKDHLTKHIVSWACHLFCAGWVSVDAIWQARIWKQKNTRDIPAAGFRKEMNPRSPPLLLSLVTLYVHDTRADRCRIAIIDSKLVFIYSCAFYLLQKCCILKTEWGNDKLMRVMFGPLTFTFEKTKESWGLWDTQSIHHSFFLY